MKKILLACFVLFSFTFLAKAQQYTISGRITDADTKEPLIGATIMTQDATGAVTDFEGNYSLTLPKGEYLLTVSYVSYSTQEIAIDLSADQTFHIEMSSENILKEVVIVADIAIERETPVAFSNIPTKKLNEELAAQDLPMILNSTPGAYATEGGGGDGDARITIRGFDQRNIAVMLDGIPVNDMENGWVYWSNWFGLDLVTQTMQVQRGLGASKLSIPSVGGTINILTKGIDAKRGFKLRQEVGNNGYLRTTIGLTSGRLKNGFGISAAASYKQGDGWVDGNFTKGYFYYLRIDKQIGNHLISLSGFGAPQQHGQRPFTAPVGTIDSSYAVALGVPDTVITRYRFVDKGRRFNAHWGRRDGKLVNLRKNYYHKPQFSLRHSWQISKDLFWSNVAYLSIGKGGGTAPDGGLSIPRSEDGQYDIDKAIENNQPTAFNPDGLSNSIIRSSNNDHFWYGILSTFNYNINDALTLSGGLDGRQYSGDHYRTIYDLLGGTGFSFGGEVLKEGDRFEYDFTSNVRWLGGFALLEYSHKDRLAAFLNVSTASSAYSFHNNMTGLGIPRIAINTKTFKAGAKYNINASQSLFFNMGYLDKAPRFANVIISNFWTNDSDARVAEEYNNEIIKAVELGYHFKSSMFSCNVNGYYTLWENKPLDRLPTVALDPSDPESDRIPVNINGINALHKGIELDFAFKPIKTLTLEGLMSIGDWRWTSKEKASVVLPSGQSYEYEFDAAGVHVGDAAQIQYGGLLRYQPVKGLYFKLKGVYFDKYYADFEPESLQDDNAGRDSWRLPAYALFSFHTGYRFTFRKIKMGLRANVLNLFDTVYLSDARNNDTFNSPSFTDFDAKSASVHFGQGRRFSLSLQIGF
ncbi:MAG TPA: TonB-dependent receptor [Phaeodactylibacter sp.]|nr:TonB-dependent receptor [Phaeodactylibacter sp.]